MLDRLRFGAGDCVEGGWLVIYSVPDELSSEKANWEWALTGPPPPRQLGQLYLTHLKVPANTGTLININYPSC